MDAAEDREGARTSPSVRCGRPAQFREKEGTRARENAVTESKERSYRPSEQLARNVFDWMNPFTAMMLIEDEEDYASFRSLDLLSAGGFERLGLLPSDFGERALYNTGRCP